ncbi:RNA polymerase sigma-70 factor [Pedobacter frigoris]|uniref:RNA polymerase sigma-70 factor n=1 Tax=Pedobacter frigoris TaxID=2571272 RepID=A0A4U1CPB6_9SPHI|nr:RNA polymerase sigma-70 factor [Pedobacter frigoris]TKC08595.1 RNA polymerase sigma-70 factor [Pedobacter frigoris]
MKVDGNLSDLSDNELISLIKQHDQPAFVFVYDKYWSEMYACAFHLFPNREICEDLIHDVFIYLWNNRSKLEIKSVRDYLYIAIKNRTLNKIRSEKFQIDIGEDQLRVSSNEAADQKILSEEIHALFEEGLRTLPEKCRKILMMSRKEHLSNKEIAERLNLSTKTVENQINIGLRKIRDFMGEVLILYFFYNFFG